jgi:acetyltransferase-like isoleucine patch superfamily enzyme
MKRIGIILAVWAFLVFAELGIWWCHSESYCFFYPTIDTTFAKGFTEEHFDMIEKGQTTASVTELLGQPIEIETNRDGTMRSWYTQDGKCRFGDFAWLGRSVLISNGVVVSAESQTYFD